MRDVRIVALNEFGQCGTFPVRWEAALHNRARGMFFRWVNLGEARSLNTSLPTVATRGELLLLHTILHDPHLRAVVIGSIADDHDLEDRFIGREIEFVVKLRDERAKFFQESDAQGLQVRLALARSGLV